MGQSTHLVGFKPADEKFKKMFEVLKGCKELGIDPPREVRDYFGWNWEEVVDEWGVKINLSPRDSQAVSSWSDDDSRWGIEVDLRELDPDIKILRFYNSV